MSVIRSNATAIAEIKRQETIMANTNLIAGWPKAALDSLSDQLYPIFKDKLEGKFTDSSIIPIEIDYRVAAPPRIILAPAEDWTAPLLERANAANQQSEVAIEPFLAELRTNPGMFTLRCDPVIVGVKIKEGTRQEFKLTYDATCDIVWKLEGKDRYWWPRVLSSRAKLNPPDPEVEKVINEIVLPIVEPMINEKLEKEKQKAISYGNLVFAIPVMRTTRDVLATFLSFRSPTVPPETLVIRDPRRTVVQMDSEFLETFINEELRKAHIDVPKQCIEFLTAKACVWAHAGLRNAKIQLRDNNVAVASMEAYGGAGVTLQVWPFPEATFQASITGTPLSFLRLEAEGGWIKVTCIVDQVEIKLQIHGVPDELMWLINKALSFMISAIAKPISAFISLFRPGIFKPDHELEFMGRKVIIKLTEMKLDTFRAPDSKVYFEAAGVGVAVKG
jgi:hypothetical protein